MATEPDVREVTTSSKSASSYTPLIQVGSGGLAHAIGARAITKAMRIQAIQGERFMANRPVTPSRGCLSNVTGPSVEKTQSTYRDLPGQARCIVVGVVVFSLAGGLTLLTANQFAQRSRCRRKLISSGRTCSSLAPRTEGVAREGRVHIEAIRPVANFVAGRQNEGHPLRVDQGEVTIAGGDEPLPLRIGEEVGAACVVGGRVGAAEEMGEQRRSQIIVGSTADDAPGWPPRPADEQRRTDLVVAVRRAVAGETQAVLVEFHAVVGGDDDDRPVEQIPALQIVEHLADQGIVVVHGTQIQRVQPRLL